MRELRAITWMFGCFALVAVAFASGCAAKPPAEDPHALVTEGALSSELLAAGKESTVFARLRLVAKESKVEHRGPVNVALVLDTSGSMEGAAIDALKLASLRMIDTLKNGDRLAVVTFDTKVRVVLPSSELDGGIRAEVKKKIGEIRAAGTTDMAAGLEQGLQEVRGHFDPKGVNRIVLLGDGVPNDAGPIDATVASAKQSGIAITTLGLGLDYDEGAMGKIAQSSGGRFQYVDKPEKVGEFFQAELARIDKVVARRATATLTPGPGVRIIRVVGVPSSANGASHSVTLGDISRGDQRDLIVELAVTPRAAGAPVEMLDAVVTFDDAVEAAGPLEQRVYLGAHGSSDGDKIAKSENADVQVTAALAIASDTTLRALELAKQGSVAEARRMLVQGAELAKKQLARTPSAKLEEQAASMLAVASDLPENPPPQPSAQAPSRASEDFDRTAPAAKSAAAPRPAPEPSPMPPAVAERRKTSHDHAIRNLQ